MQHGELFEISDMIDLYGEYNFLEESTYVQAGNELSEYTNIVL